MQNFFVVTGAMGAGKSTVLAEIEKSGQLVMPEPARKILAEQRSFDGNGVPETDPKLFIELILSRSLYFYNECKEIAAPVLFDRGVADIVAHARLSGVSEEPYMRAAKTFSFNKKVLLFPAWEEIYTTDDERKMSFEAAKKFGDDVASIYKQLGYELIEVPKVSVAERARFISSQIV